MHSLAPILLCTMKYSWGRKVVASVLTGFVVALIVHVINLLAFASSYLSNSTSPTSYAIYPQVSGYFQLAAVFTFVLIIVAGVIGAFTRWWTSVIAGVVIALIAVMAFTLIQVTAQGSGISGAVVLFIVQSLVGINVIYLVSIIVLVPTFGRWLFFKILGYQGRPLPENRIALVRIPASNLSEGLVSHGERVSVDSELADQQWDAYVAALVAAGWKTVEVAPADNQADSAFVEDTAVLFGRTAVITLPGAEARRSETAGTEASLRELGLDIERIEEPGTLDGGDVLKVGKTVYVGRTERTNAEGIRQLRAIVTSLGYTVVAVPVSKALHLKSVATALPDGTVVGFPELIDDTSVFDRFIAVPEAHGTAVLVVADDSVIMSAAAPQSAALVADLGYTVTTVDISEFEKLEAGVTCLSVRVR